MKKWLPAVGFFVILLTWFFYPKFAASLNADPAARGQYGDMYGGLNTLFSGLAFAGLIYTVLLQREELGLQRRELELTRAELERTAKANEAAATAMAEQVKNQLLAARISGLAGLVAAYDNAIVRGQVSVGGYSVQTDEGSIHKSSELRGQLEELLKGLEENNSPSQIARGDSAVS